jgi:hypothetical protein
MRMRPMLVLKWVLGLALAAYVGAVALLYVKQRDMNEPKRMVRFPLGGHENLDDFGALGTVRDFLYK